MLVAPAIMIVLFNPFPLHSLGYHIHLSCPRVPDLCSSCIECPIKEEGPEIKADVQGTYTHEVSVSSFVCGIFELISFKQLSGSTYIVVCRHFGKCLPKIISIRFYFSTEKVGLFTETITEV